MYYKPSTGERFALHSDVRRAMPNVLFGDSISEADLIALGIFPVVQDEPAVEPGRVAVPLSIELIDDQWTQLWTIRDATPDEIEAGKPPVPQQISSGQGREDYSRAAVMNSSSSASSSRPSAAPIIVTSGLLRATTLE